MDILKVTVYLLSGQKFEFYATEISVAPDLSSISYRNADGKVTNLVGIRMEHVSAITADPHLTAAEAEQQAAERAALYPPAPRV